MLIGHPRPSSSLAIYVVSMRCNAKAHRILTAYSLRLLRKRPFFRKPPCVISFRLYLVGTETCYQIVLSPATPLFWSTPASRTLLLKRIALLLPFEPVWQPRLTKRRFLFWRFRCRGKVPPSAPTVSLSRQCSTAFLSFHKFAQLLCGLRR